MVKLHNTENREDLKCSQSFKNSLKGVSLRLKDSLSAEEQAKESGV